MSLNLSRTFILLKVLNLIVGLHVSEEDEKIGMDISQHGEWIPT